jgi:hypothetical protein
VYQVIRHPTKDGWTFDDGTKRTLSWYRWQRAAHPTAIAVMLMLHDRMGVPWQEIVWNWKAAT